MGTVAIIQARMGSTRLPGKVMLPLNTEHVLTHVVQRAGRANSVDSVVVATSTERQDDIIEYHCDRTGVTIHRGSESDVLDRMHQSAQRADASTVVRLTADCPLIHPGTIDAVVQPVATGDADYATNIIDRTFPRGLDVEAFTFESFDRVHEKAVKSHHREHVTPYYRENPTKFDLLNVPSKVVFDEPDFCGRTDLRLTLDEAADYEVLRQIYSGVSYDRYLPIRDAIRYVDEHGLMGLNEAVAQKEV